MSKVIVLFSDNETVPYDDCDYATVGDSGELILYEKGAVNALIAADQWKICDIHAGND